MARYIDADALIERILKLKVATDDMYGMGIARGIERAETAIQMQPTADVAPKSEVAREIEAFGEKVGKIYNHYVFEDTDYADDDVAIEAVINALTEVLNELADLNKKFTEGEE